MDDVTRQVIPAPVGGWNARDPYAGMPLTDAITLDNWFPDTYGVKLRKGFTPFVSSGLGSADVPTLIELPLVDGTNKFIAAANDNIFDITSGSASSIKGSATVSEEKWQHTIFRNRAFLVNGTDDPISWTGSGNVTVPAWVGSGLTNTSLVNVSSFKGHLYFVEKNTFNLWYAELEAITGTLTKSDHQSFFRLGGYLMAAGPSTQNVSDTTAEIFVLISSKGEILCYAGDPGDWTLIGRYIIPPPIGRRCMFYLGTDLHIITTRGVIPLSNIRGSVTEGAAKYSMLTDKIEKAFNDAAVLGSSTFGWEAVNYPNGKYALINVMTAGNKSVQFVMNTITGSWARFRGQNAATWCVFNNDLYFGGFDGKVYKADTGQSDDDAQILTSYKSAFTDGGKPGAIKFMKFVRPFFTATADVTPEINFDFDFAFVPQTAATAIGTGSGEAWDVAEWDVSSWDDILVTRLEEQNASGSGFYVSLCLDLYFKNIDVEYYRSLVTFEVGEDL